MNIKHELSAIAEQMQLSLNNLSDRPINTDQVQDLYSQMEANIKRIAELAASMKDPDLYIGDRLKAAIILGQERVFLGEPDAVTRAFMEMMTQEELALFWLFRARREHLAQAHADWAATKSKEPPPRNQDYGLGDTPERNYMGAVDRWLTGAQDTPRPQKSDFGLRPDELWIEKV
jgi:hypothetical protein